MRDIWSKIQIWIVLNLLFSIFILSNDYIKGLSIYGIIFILLHRVLNRHKVKEYKYLSLRIFSYYVFLILFFIPILGILFYFIKIPIPLVATMLICITFVASHLVIKRRMQAWVFWGIAYCVAFIVFCSIKDKDLHTLRLNIVWGILIIESYVNCRKQSH